MAEILQCVYLQDEYADYVESNNTQYKLLEMYFYLQNTSGYSVIRLCIHIHTDVWRLSLQMFKTAFLIKDETKTLM